MNSSSSESAEPPPNNAAMELYAHMMDCAALLPRHLLFVAASASSIRGAHAETEEGGDGQGEGGEGVFGKYVERHCPLALPHAGAFPTETPPSAEVPTQRHVKSLRDLEERVVVVDLFSLSGRVSREDADEGGGPSASSLLHRVVAFSFEVGFFVVRRREINSGGEVGPWEQVTPLDADERRGEGIYESLVSLLVNTAP